MAVAVGKKKFTVAVIGNPNTGKSTLFSALVGVRQRVGNYPGVTVEKRLGRFEVNGKTFELVDLPGLYSLAPRSRDEMVAVDVLLNRFSDCDPVDLVLCIVDASNLERNLYLVTQVLELGVPAVVAVNMLDVAEAKHVKLDLENLAAKLGVPVVGVQANVRRGIDRLREVLEHTAENATVSNAYCCRFPKAFEEEVTALATDIAKAEQFRRILSLRDATRQSETGESDEAQRKSSVSPGVERYLAVRLLLDVSGFLAQSLGIHAEDPWLVRLQEARERLKDRGIRIPGVEPEIRYACVRELLADAVEIPDRYPTTLSDKIDAVLTHPVLGLAVFAVVMTTMFQAIFAGADPLIGLIESAVGYVGDAAASVVPPGPLQSLLVDGVIGGVGAVIVFLPQILILFVFLAVLEDCGYIARAAYLMDRFMVRLGLSGKAFIPMLSSFACAVPGIMATRTIENERDRLTTILVAPLMTCSARLPVYALLIAVFVPDVRYLGGWIGLQGLVLTALYLLGIAAAVCVAFLLRRTLLRGRSTAFVMELPSYKLPDVGTVVWRVLERGWVFLRSAGTLIFATSIVVWALLYYPRPVEVEAPFAARRAELTAALESLPRESADRLAVEAELERLEREIDMAYQHQSWLGRMG
ncbi:MAG: ferrous iron transport protein B, partial [Planctomycetota bacterium]